jgi:alkanesulfonate monooxygenase SsuD/methylene tetrahydromethanopterin reductase-like flavin-dependent oxidoreductase (luciferase family)
VTPLILGLNLSTSAAAGADPAADALEAERLGFDFVSANDHPMGGSPTHELWTLLAWVAARTSTIKVASRVLGVPYRNPAVVAKMAASLQALSGGRLILGIGGGSSDEGMAAVGAGTMTARAKIDGLEDALRIIRGLWSESGFSRGLRNRSRSGPGPTDREASA